MLKPPQQIRGASQPLDACCRVAAMLIARCCFEIHVSGISRTSCFHFLIFAASDAVVVVCPVVHQDYVLRARLDTPQFHGLACEIIRKNLCLRIVQSDQIARDFGFPGDGSKIEIGLKSG